MAQTTGQISGADNTIEASTNGSDWTDISGSVNNVEPSGGERKTGSAHTFTGDTPIVSAGKRDEVSVKLSIIYTETAGEATALLNSYYANATPVWLRYRPRGAGGTYWEFTSSGAGYIKSMIAPKVAADSDKPVVVDATWVGPGLSQAAQA